MTLAPDDIDLLAQRYGEPEYRGSLIFFGGSGGLKIDTVKDRYFNFADESTGDVNDLLVQIDADANGHDEGPPQQDLDEERALLGMILCQPSLAGSVEEDVGSIDFVDVKHAKVFTAILDTLNAGARPGINEVVRALGGNGSGQYAASLMSDAPLPANGDEAITLARDLARSIRARADLDRKGYADDGDPLPDEKHVPQYGLVMWNEIESGTFVEYEYAIQGLIPVREPVLIYGESQSGKSFFTFDMAMCLALGRPFFGRRVLRPMGVVYCAYEAGQGFRDRLRAYQRYHQIPSDQSVPFALLTRPVDLWTDALNVNKLIEEIRWISKQRFGDTPLGAVIIDTHNAATPGASEVDSKDISTLLRRYHGLREQLGCGLWIVSHKNAKGDLRGNLQLYNRIETAIDIAKKVEKRDGMLVPVRDPSGHILRVARIQKQREGAADGASWEFVLRGVDVGRIDAYGEKVTSCVTTSPGEGIDAVATVSSQTGKPFVVPPGYVDLKPNAREIFIALATALENSGRRPPSDVRAPSGAVAIQWKDWHTERVRQLQGTDESPDAIANRAKSHIAHARKTWAGRLINYDQGWYWRTRRKVAGVDAPPDPEARPVSERPSLMTDEDVEDLTR